MVSVGQQEGYPKDKHRWPKHLFPGKVKHEQSLPRHTAIRALLTKQCLRQKQRQTTLSALADTAAHENTEGKKTTNVPQLRREAWLFQRKPLQQRFLLPVKLLPVDKSARLVAEKTHRATLRTTPSTAGKREGPRGLPQGRSVRADRQADQRRRAQQVHGRLLPQPVTPVKKRPGRQGKRGPRPERRCFHDGRAARVLPGQSPSDNAVGFLRNKKDGKPPAGPSELHASPAKRGRTGQDGIAVLVAQSTDKGLRTGKRHSSSRQKAGLGQGPARGKLVNGKAAKKNCVPAHEGRKAVGVTAEAEENKTAELRQP